MDVMPWQAVMFVSIPEAFLLILMGFTLAGVKPDLKRLVTVAVFQALGSYFIRGLDLPFGIHIVLQLITMLVLVKLILSYKWRIVLPGVMLGFALFTGILDSIYIPFVVVRIVPLEVILNNVWIRIAVSIPQQLVMLSVILLCHKYDFNIIDMSSYEEGM